MKLLGIHNKTHFIASIGHYDYIKYADMMMDGGQPGCSDYAGYWRSSGRTCYAEVPQTFAELFTDYQTSPHDKRQYGVWPIKEVKILKESEYPDINSWSWKVDNAVWGTRGKNGDEKLRYIHLKDAETDHLVAILDTQYCISGETKQIIEHILSQRK